MDEPKDLQDVNRMQLEMNQDILRMESRLYSLEKEMGLVANLVTIAAIVGAYYLYQWYLQRLATIPGVATE